MRWLSLFALLWSAACRAEPPGLVVTVSGPPVTVWSHDRNSCDADDIPDAPARAVRLASGEVVLFAAHLRNRLLRGANLLSVRMDCHVVYQGKEDDDPANFDDRAWLVSPYTIDGKRIFSVVHNEFQGHRRPWLCPSGRYLDCWYNALTIAISDDGGESFHRPENALLATLPYRYADVVGAHRGYFNPSNIIGLDDSLYMFAFATEALAQRPGNCLLRTAVPDDAASWRAWNGHAFEAAFVDPYHDTDAPEKHICAPVGLGRLRWPVTSLVRHAASGLFIASMMNDGEGVYFATSRDLIAWSDPVLVWKATGEGGWRCGAEPPIAFPSLLDPRSASRNFEAVGDSAQLFLTVWRPSGCHLGMDRDLVRLKVTISPNGNPVR